MRSSFAPMVAAMALLLSGCIMPRMFVDPALGDVPSAERIAAANPRPVQFIFEFRTKGAANARATNQLRAQMTEIVSASGQFSEVSSAPVPNGAILAVTIDNVPQEDAAARGFGTGLTFGLAGTTVTDFYEANARFVPQAGASEIRTQVRHAIHSQIGATEAPANMVQAATPQEAVNTTMRQILERLIYNLAKEPGFSPAPGPGAARETVDAVG
jgi:hypothetical protein